MLSQREVRVRTTRALQSLHALLGAVAPIALRPVAMVLTHALAAAEPFLPVRGYNRPLDAAIDWSDVLSGGGSSPDEDDESDEVFSHGVLDWLPCLLALLKVLSASDEMALVTSLQALLTRRGGEPGPLSPSTSGTSDAPPSAGAAGAPPAHVLAEFLLVAIRVVALHFTRDTTVRSDVLSQQFAQLLQYSYVMLSRGSSSALVQAARDLAEDHCGAISEAMSLAVYSNSLLAVYWCQILVALDIEEIGAGWGGEGRGEERHIRGVLSA